MGAWTNEQHGLLLVETGNNPIITFVNVIRSRNVNLAPNMVFDISIITVKNNIPLTAYTWTDFPQELYKYDKASGTEHLWTLISSDLSNHIANYTHSFSRCTTGICFTPHQSDVPVNLYSINKDSDGFTSIPYHKWDTAATNPINLPPLSSGAPMAPPATTHTPAVGDIYLSIDTDREIELVKIKSNGRSWQGKVVKASPTHPNTSGQLVIVNPASMTLVKAAPINRCARVLGTFISTPTDSNCPTPAQATQQTLTDDELEYRFWAADKGSWSGRNKERNTK